MAFGMHYGCSCRCGKTISRVSYEGSSQFKAARPDNGFPYLRHDFSFTVDLAQSMIPVHGTVSTRSGTGQSDTGVGRVCLYDGLDHPTRLWVSAEASDIGLPVGVGTPSQLFFPGAGSRPVVSGDRATVWAVGALAIVRLDIETGEEVSRLTRATLAASTPAYYGPGRPGGYQIAQLYPIPGTGQMYFWNGFAESSGLDALYLIDENFAQIRSSTGTGASATRYWHAMMRGQLFVCDVQAGVPRAIYKRLAATLTVEDSDTQTNVTGSKLIGYDDDHFVVYESRNSSGGANRYACYDWDLNRKWEKVETGTSIATDRKRQCVTGQSFYDRPQRSVFRRNSIVDGSTIWEVPVNSAGPLSEPLCVAAITTSDGDRCIVMHPTHAVPTYPIEGRFLELGIVSLDPATGAPFWPAGGNNDPDYVWVEFPGPAGTEDVGYPSGQLVATERNGVWSCGVISRNGY